VDKLAQDQSPEARKEIAEKVSKTYMDADKDPSLSRKSRELVEGIFRGLVADTATEVRATLAQNLKTSKDLPHDIALTMASDVSEVASPLLEFSEVLTDEDLKEIIESTGLEHQMAIASREEISDNIVDSLLETENAEIANAVFLNDGAEISENSFNKALDTFSDNENVVEALVTNSKITDAIIEKVAEKVSEQIQTNIAGKYNEANIAALSTNVRRVRDLAKLKMIGLRVNDLEMERIIRGMMHDGSLSPLSALCMCSLQLFIATCARQLKVPMKNVSILANDEGAHGPYSLFKALDIHERMHKAAFILLQTVIEIGRSDVTKNLEGDAFHEAFTAKLNEKIQNEVVPSIEFFLNLIEHYHNDEVAPPQQESDF
jgi:uncharacterized protein (DUF2336 family)